MKYRQVGRYVFRVKIYGEQAKTAENGLHCFDLAIK